MELELSPRQATAMEVTERVSSIFSLCGIFFILSTFLLCRGFDKPINRLIFFASWSNLGMNIASLIARDGIAAGQDSSLCQFQAWAIQMFLGVDVFWALCMAFNVYLALFQRWPAARMRALEWKYFVGCYGASFVPAFTYLFVQTNRRGKVYGPALLWCWIGPEWDYLRLVTLYAIVWVAFLATVIIYCFAFRKVWRSRHELRGIFNPFNEDPFVGVIVTEIEITHHSRPPPSSGRDCLPEGGKPATSDTTDFAFESSRLSELHEIDGTGTFDPYTVNVEAGETEIERSQSLHHQNRLPSIPTPASKPTDPFGGVRSWTRNAALHETNPESWLYARVAFLFFFALLISWIPSSINRLYSIIRPNFLVFMLNYTETLVLPLQGFWNAVVYIITSQTACRNLYRSLVGKPELPRKNMDGSGGASGAYGASFHSGGGGPIWHRRMRSRLADAITGGEGSQGGAEAAVAGVTYRGKEEEFPPPPVPGTRETIVKGAKSIKRKVIGMHPPAHALTSKDNKDDNSGDDSSGLNNSTATAWAGTVTGSQAHADDNSKLTGPAPVATKTKTKTNRGLGTDLVASKLDQDVLDDLNADAGSRASGTSILALTPAQTREPL